MKEVVSGARGDPFHLDEVEDAHLKSFLKVLDAGMTLDRIHEQDITNIGCLFDVSGGSIARLLSSKDGIIGSIKGSTSRQREFSKASILALFTYLYVKNQYLGERVRQQRDRILYVTRQKLGKGHTLYGELINPSSPNKRENEELTRGRKLFLENERRLVEQTSWEDVTQWSGSFRTVPKRELRERVGSQRMKKFGIDMPPPVTDQFISFGKGIDILKNSKERVIVNYGDSEITMGRLSGNIDIALEYHRRHPQLTLVQLFDRVRELSQRTI